MHGLDALIGARIDAITFGVAHFQLRLSTEQEAYSVSTSADVSCEPSKGDPFDFREDKACSGLVGLIGAELCSLAVDEPGRSASLHFDEGRQVRAWWPDKVYDNIFIVRREGSDEWWVVE